MTGERLEPGALMAMARTLGGSTDFGDPGFREGLEVLTDSLEREARLSEEGRLRMKLVLVQGLVNRLRIHQTLADHPEIAESEVPRPLIVVGFPRSGTTLLHRLLALDPGGRSLAFWELLAPAPPPTPERYHTDPRIQTAMLMQPTAELRAIHPYAEQEPEECNWLLRNTFRTPFFSHFAHVPTYLDWVLRQDPAPAYREYRTQLQILTWRCGGTHLVLKAPIHLWRPQALLDALPDARLVHLHRDTHAALASYASLIESVRRLASDRVDPAEVAGLVTRRFVETARRTLAIRETEGERFLDLGYDELVADPLSAVARVQAHAGLTLDDELEERIQVWLALHPQGEHGVHRYSLDRYVRDPRSFDQEMEPYRARFGVA